MSSPTRVSIVIPTKNGAKTLKALFDALWTQRFAGGLEVIAIDSGSTDGTLELLEKRVNRLITVPRNKFNHGLTRNLAIEAATGDLVVLMVQDAIPQSDKWLAGLTAPLRADPAIAGSFARQVPREGASGLSRYYHRQWVAATETGFVSALSGQAEFAALSPRERHDRCAFDNVCSCVRRSVWAEHPFHETPIAEDVGWAREVLLAGHRIAFSPDAVVEHSHDRSVWYEFTRTRAAHEQLGNLFGLALVPNVLVLARAIVSSAAVHVWCELGFPERWPRALALAVAWPAGQYLGAKRAHVGEADVAALGLGG